MRHALRHLSIAVSAPFGVLLALGVLLNTGPGRHLTEQAVRGATGGDVNISGLSGRFPDALRAATVQVRDAQGVWLSVRDAELDWSPWQLWSGEARITRLTAAGVDVLRLPASNTPAPSIPDAPGGAPDFGWASLPVRAVLDHVTIAHLTVAEAVAGHAATLTVEASTAIDSPGSLIADLTLRTADGRGLYRVSGRASAAGVEAALNAAEPAQGLAASLAGLPDAGALALTATLKGGWDAIATNLTLTAGDLSASVAGDVDVAGSTANLALQARAPAMTPRPGLSWQGIALSAHVTGPWLSPQAQGNASIDGLTASGASVARFAATIRGGLGHVFLQGAVEALHLPGPAPDLFAAVPVAVQADLQLDAANQPLNVTLTHPLLSASAHAQLAGAPGLTAHVDLPSLATLAPFGVPALPGGAALDVAAVAQGAGVNVSLLHLATTALSLDAKGSAGADGLDVAWTAQVPDLSLLAATVQGSAKAQGRVHGPLDSFDAEATVTGEAATAQVPRGPLKVTLAAHGLPDAPSGEVTAEGSLDGAPLTLAASANRADGGIAVKIRQADWKSLHAEGTAALDTAGTAPAGAISLRVERLEDLSGLLGQKLTGALAAEMALHGTEATLRATASNAGLPGQATAASASLDAHVTDPLTAPNLTATLGLGGLRAGTLGGSAKLEANGKPEAVAVRLTADLTGAGGAPLRAAATGRLDTRGQTLTLASLQADWQAETLRLLAPTRVAFGNGVSLDRARFGWHDAVLDLSGRAAPALDMTASLRNLSAGLIQLVLPEMHLAGMLSADAKLTGRPDRPDGRLHLAASGLHLRDGPGAALPPGTITADATLAAGAARLTARASAGTNSFALTGTAPLDANGAMALRATGSADLAALDPLLSAEGRRARGHVALDAEITGSPSHPRASGTFKLTGGDVQDVQLGLHLAEIDALLDASGDSIRIVHATGKAGRGTVSASGTIGLEGAMAVDLAVKGENAQPLANELLNATLGLDLTARGVVFGPLALGGTITINRADIRIPERMPVKVAVLDVRRPGQTAPPPPSSAGSQITLNLALRAQDEIFVRGRGLDAELQGRINIGGTVQAVQPSGRFKLRRGTVNLAGQTLRFTSGEVGFDGSTGLDPALNLVATSTSGSVTATLTVTGYASAPKIVLSSVPDLPQDEILAQVLFHQTSTSLSAAQLAQSAAALAQISGIGPGFDPLNKIRTTFGLDRLSVGSAANGTGTSVEAGRYVADGIYVGAKQTTAGGGTQAIVQIDLTRRLKVQATAATSSSSSATGASSTQDPSGSSLGIAYQFDY